MDFTEKTERFIRESGMLRQKGSVTVGISGGADSVCLFLQLSDLREKLGIELKAVTVEHGIRGDESESDAEFSKKLCESHGVHCEVVHVDAPGRAREKGISLEEAARQLRYEAFFQNTEPGDVIALAHHLEDQAETVIFHMVRGSGVRGLTGMRPVSEVQGRYIIRPLLFATKREITDELESLGQEWRTDSTNSDVNYARNRIRQIIIPELTRINAGAARHICEAASDIGQMYDGFTEKEDAYIAANESDGGLDCRKLAESDEYTRGMVIMEYLRRQLKSIKDVGREHIDRLSALVKKGENFRYDLPAGAEVFFEYGVLKVSYRREDTGFFYGLDELAQTGFQQIKTEDFNVTFSVRDFDLSEIKDIPQKNYEKWLDYDKIVKSFCIRSRAPGDFFTIDQDGHRQKFKDFCVNAKIPASERGRIPLLVSGEHHVLWALGTQRISEDVKLSEKTKKVLVVKCTTSGGNESDGR